MATDPPSPRAAPPTPVPGEDEATAILPEDLALTPISRRPTVLPADTVAAAMGALFRLPDASPLSAEPELSIIVVTFNGEVFTRLCLATLLPDAMRNGYEVIVVDNASTDGTRAFLEQVAQRCRNLRAIFNGENRGFSAANNQGLALARGRNLLLLNNDTLTPPGWARPLLRRLGDGGVGLVGPVSNRACNEAQIPVDYHTYGGFVRFAARRSMTHAGLSLPVSMLAMYCLAMTRRTFALLGPLDEGYGLGFFEDDDYARRAAAAGLSIVCAEDAFVHHFGEGSFGHLYGTGEQSLLFERNKARFEQKWKTQWTPHARRENLAYAALVDQIAAVVEREIPAGAPGARVVIAVISHGDDALLRRLTTPTREARHLPAGENGAYAGHHPADGIEALRHLQRSIAGGARFLVVPSPCAWWLTHYDALRRELEVNWTKRSQQESCTIFELDRIS